MEKGRLLEELKAGLQKGGAFNLSNVRAKDIFCHDKQIAIPTRTIYDDREKDYYIVQLGSEIAKIYHCQFTPIRMGCYKWLCFVFKPNTGISNYLVVLKAYQAGLEYISNETNRARIYNEALAKAAINIAIPPRAIYSQ